MKFYWNENVYGWCMYGLVGKDAGWFLGVSRRLATIRPTPEQIAAAGERALRSLRALSREMGEEL